MFLGRDFPPFQNDAARLLGADLANLLASGETITGVSAALTTLAGSDTRPDQHLPRPAQFSGAQVTQLVSFSDPAGMLLGNRYALAFSIATSLRQVMVPWSRFVVAAGLGVTGYAGAQPPAAAQGMPLIAAPLFYTLPILEGGYIGTDFPAVNQAETLLYGLDFAAALSPNETITSAGSFLALLDGSDAAVTASPSAYNVGNPAVAGTVVQQMLAWPGGGSLTANVYALSLTANTSFGQSLAAWARITVEAIG